MSTRTWCTWAELSRKARYTAVPHSERGPGNWAAHPAFGLQGKNGQTRQNISHVFTCHSLYMFISLSLPSLSCVSLFLEAISQIGLFAFCIPFCSSKSTISWLLLAFQSSFTVHPRSTIRAIPHGSLDSLVIRWPRFCSVSPTSAGSFSSKDLQALNISSQALGTHSAFFTKDSAARSN